MQPSILSILPPLLVLVLGITTRRVLFSLFFGIASASFIAGKFSIIQAITLMTKRFAQTLNLHSLYSWELLMSNQTLLILFFLCMLGTLVRLLESCGGASAYVSSVKKHITTPKQAESASLFLSLSLFIDDYFSTLTVGSLMRPLTDPMKIPRVKLAFLVDSMAAPLSIIMPISSWVAVIIGQLSKAGITTDSQAVLFGDPFIVYLSSIPFVAYSFIMMASAFFIVQKRISFGPMAYHEDIAQNTGNLFGGKSPSQEIIREQNTSNASLLDFIVPVASFIIGVFGGLLYTGSYHLCGGSHDFLNALRCADSSQALAGGSLMAVLISITFLLLRKKLSTQAIMPSLAEGSLVMLPAITILLMSWTLGDILSKDLMTGVYLAKTCVGSLWAPLFPLTLFITSGLISFAMGSSWGAIAIIIPIAIPMILSLSGQLAPFVATQIALLFPSVGAILSGAILGDHISPISDTTAMSSASTGSYHMDHVYTQFFYTAPVFIGSCLSFIASGVLIPYGITLSSVGSLAIGTATSFGILTLLHNPKECK